MSHWLTDSPIDHAALLEDVTTASCGATALFLGTVRSSPEDGEIDWIEYTAYPEMAEAEFERIVAEVSERWPMVRIALLHRLGYVPTGEASIAIATASPHSAEAYEASRYILAETKKRVPIWKKERLSSGQTRWVGGQQPAEALP